MLDISFIIKYFCIYAIVYIALLLDFLC